MTEVVVGFRRLFDSIGAGIQVPETCVTGKLGQHYVEVYMGSRPTWGIEVGTADRYTVPGEAAWLWKGGFFTDPADSGYPRRFFTEVSAWMAVDVAPGSVTEIREGGPARDHILSSLECEHPEFARSVDLVAGSLGLRLHRQFVLIEVSANYFAIAEEIPVHQSIGPTVENLETVALNPTGHRVLESVVRGFHGAAEEDIQWAADAFRWLRRAWASNDTIEQFMALFIPIEIVLQGVRVAESESEASLRNSIEALILASGSDESDQMMSWMKRRGRLRPSLAERFEALASHHGGKGWQRDVDAFRVFNKRRNEIMHRGVHNASVHVTVDESEVRSLEDLAERYLCLRIFGDERVYSSAWRPERS